MDKMNHIYFDFNLYLTTGRPKSIKGWFLDENSDLTPSGDSLESQFNHLNNRLELGNRFESLKHLIETVIPTDTEKDFYFISADLTRDRPQVFSKSADIYTNVFVRPEKTLLLEKLIGKDQQLIFITDLYFDRTTLGKKSYFIVKGIELIHDSFPKNLELKVERLLVSYFIDISPYNISGFKMPEFDSMTTPDFIVALLEKYPVKNVNKLLTYYQKWDKFTKFQKALLKQTQDKVIALNEVSIKKGILIAKKHFIEHQDQLRAYVFDKLTNKFADKNSEQILLEENDVVEELNLPGLEQTVIKLEVDFLEKEIKAQLAERTSRTLTKTAETLKFFSNAVEVGQFVTNNRNQEKQVQGISLEETFRRFEYVVEPVSEINKLRSESSKAQKEEEARLLERQKSIVKQLIKEKITIVIAPDLQRLLDEEKDEIERLLNQSQKFLNNKQNTQYIEARNELVLSIRNKYKDELASLKNRINSNKDRDNEKKKLNILNQQVEDEINKININEIFEVFRKKQERLIHQKFKQKKEFLEKKLTENLKQEIESAYAQQFNAELFELRNSFQSSLNEKITQLNIEKNIARVAVYYLAPIEKFEALEDSIEKLLRQNQIVAAPNLVADRIKIDRQRKALESFFNGFVRNPFLSTFLFEPSLMSEKYKSFEGPQNFFTKRQLNESQIEAISKAVSSHGLFLLQGPPGTGKTEVIAEIASQYIAKNQKVIISSETHKAIDNVFERLPKRSEIRAIRLVKNFANREINVDSSEISGNTNSKKTGKFKDQAYHPSALLVNFYENITANMDNTLAKYEKKEKYLESFQEKFNELQLLKSSFEKNQKLVAVLEKEINEIQIKVSNIRDQQTPLKTNLFNLSEEFQECNLFLKNIEKFHVDLNDNSNEYKINLWKKYVEKLPIRLSLDSADDIKNSIPILRSIFRLLKDKKRLDSEVLILSRFPESILLQKEKNSLREKIMKNQDEYGISASTINKPLTARLLEINKLLKDGLNSNYDLDIDNFDLENIIETALIKGAGVDLNSVVEKMMEKIRTNHQSQLQYNQNIMQSLKTKIQGFEELIQSKDLEIKSLMNKQLELDEENKLIDLTQEIKKLQAKVDEFFKVFDLTHPTNKLEDSFAFLKKEWEKQIELFIKEKSSNGLLIDTYTKISNYLKNDEVINEDKKTITSKLYELTNLVGMTCTASALLRRNDASDINSDLVLDEFNVREMGADVVIIDEVSKSSFLELIIPILYAKSVILVGDHRQLPPQYPYKHIQDHETEGIDETIFNPELKKTFEELYEKSFFQLLYEESPENLKVMLRNQYRSHEDIMNVFNVFYSNKLKLGDIKNQNNLKQHFLNLHHKGKPIIMTKDHVVFINSRKWEARNTLNFSTSIYNEGEASAVISLLSLMNEQLINDRNNHVISPMIDLDRQVDERLSVGVITTYGDQASYIKNKIRRQKMKFEGFNQRFDDRLVISTVDDFQGDERDVIILSLVRNPEKSHSNPGFILDYRRINVAMSRARKLLVIVGNKDYLTQKGIIDLPDVDGDTRLNKKNFAVYQEILNYIRDHGRMLEAEDVL